jgi:hypothetical protein
MKMVKMFDWYKEIQSYLDTLDTKYNLSDLADLGEDIKNDTAIRFWIEKHDDDFENTLVKYFLSQGCKEDEIVYIWISW